MKIATFNANSIRARLEIVLDWLREHQPDVLAIQETKVQDEEFPAEAFKTLGYHVCFKGEKSYNGVCIISKSEPQKVRFGFDDGGPVDDTRLVTALIDGVHIVNTYVPQGRAIDNIMYKYKLGWYKRLKKRFARDYAPDQPVIWLGDMNIAVEPIDVADPAGKMKDPCYHEDCRRGFLEVCEWGFEDMLRKHHAGQPDLYSFFDYRVKDAVQKKIGWRIDYILATSSLAGMCTSCEIDTEPRLKEKPSDHTFMVAEFDWN